MDSSAEAAYDSKELRNRYEVAYICHLHLQYDAVCASLDSIHDQVLPIQTDSILTFGSIGTINTIIVLVAGMGLQSAARDVQLLQHEFPCLKFILSIGLCGAVPNTRERILLGDVVVSTNITQMTVGKLCADPNSDTVRDLQAWPSQYLAGILKTIRSEDDIPRRLESMLNIIHNSIFSNRSKHDSDDFEQAVYPNVHYGRLASSAMLIKDTRVRDRLAQSLQVIGFEMDVAELHPPAKLPLLVVRGVSDYADHKKTKDWQLRATLAASAYAKLFLQLVEQTGDLAKDADLHDTFTKLASSTISEANVTRQHGQAKVICWTLHEMSGTTGNERTHGNVHKQASQMPYESMLVQEGLGQLEKRFCMPRYTCKPVAIQDLCPGSTYRGICKLKMIYENCPQDEFIGTGWMIDATTLVTAGHNVYDPKDGHAISISVILGYAPNNNPQGIDICTETRHAKYIAIHASSYNGQKRECDLAIIQVDQKFNEVTPFAYEQPRLRETAQVRIVGFPGDEFSTDGEVMYESSGNITWNLQATSYTLLHRLDTSGGSSGSPVLRVDGSRLVAIGVHVAGQPKLTNTAVVIGKTDNIGGLNNVIPAFLRALSVHRDPRNDQNGSATVTPTKCAPSISPLQEICIPLSSRP